jgi:hypothetical protein
MITIKMHCTYITDTPFTALRLFLHKVSFTIDTLFPPTRETLYAGRVEPSAETLGFYTRAFLQLVVFRKTASSECILQGAKNMEVGGCQIGNVETIGRIEGQHTHSTRTPASMCVQHTITEAS